MTAAKKSAAKKPAAKKPPAKKTAAKKSGAKKPPAKKSAAKKSGAKKPPANRPDAARAGSSGPANDSDAELRQALVDLQGWKGEWWPRTTGLGQMQMWWRAYTTRILPTDESADPEPDGIITH